MTFVGTDPGYRDAELLFKLQQRSEETWTAPSQIQIGPGFKAKDLPLRSRKPVSYGLTYYFPVQLTDDKLPRIEGDLTLNSYAGGFLPTRKFSESFKVSLERNQVGKTVELKGDRGSTVKLRLMSVCDFNIYETIDIAAIRKSLRADLETSGARVFDERSGDRALYSRPTNAIWIGAKAPEECMLMAIRTFSVKYAIPLKGVFAMGEGHHGKWFFNPYGVTLGYSAEVESRPEITRAMIVDLAKPGAKARLISNEIPSTAPAAPPAQQAGAVPSKS
ncbi:MAG TPA: hypothetical protein VM598_07625 [Bdellovibrionota bacterium]|nr:hypothetical protein [Bdellovibrionota bacterium]